jgi:DnaJ-class molecular chaperone
VVKDCPECRGKGEREAPTAFSLSKMIINALEYPRKCDLCDGSGRIPDNVVAAPRLSWTPYRIICDACGRPHKFQTYGPHHDNYCGSCGARL